MKSFSIWRFLLTAVLITVLAQILYMADGMLGMQYYTDPQYASVWSKIMMPNAGPPPASFYILSVAFNFVGALLFTFVYAVLKHAVPGATLSSKGALFGFLIFLFTGISAALAMILLMNLPLALIGMWTVEDFLIKLGGGLIAAHVNK